MECVKCDVCEMMELELFSKLDKKEKLQINLLSNGKIYKKNEVLFNQGDILDSIFLMRTGSVKLFKYCEDGREVTLDIRHKNDIIGEANLFFQQEQMYSAVVLEDALICKCSKRDFLELLQNPTIAYKLIQGLVLKLNENIDEVSSIFTDDVKHRIIKKLTYIAEHNSTLNSDGVQLHVPLTHEEIANLVNASRVMVTRCINQLREEGLLEIRDKKYVLRNIENKLML